MAADNTSMKSIQISEESISICHVAFICQPNIFGVADLDDLALTSKILTPVIFIEEGIQGVFPKNTMHPCYILHHFVTTLTSSLSTCGSQTYLQT